ncbi:hypothetical protein F8M41_017523 [Gigaspora margarita]|uniref:Uncharacterized protein n=1 Tax=Gigaspora margarita TaxID=4874 RepID=A0A8H4AN29_GIGMA|nr:hypothetical protein F8M41_017523 [Gigaspora margarita]
MDLRKIERKEKFLLPGEGKSNTEDEESKVVEERGQNKRRRKSQQSESSFRKGKHARTRSFLTILNSPRETHDISEISEASLEKAGTSNTSAGHQQSPIYDAEHSQES